MFARKPRSCSEKHYRLSQGFVAPASQEPLSWDFAAEIGLVSAFGTPQVISGAWVGAAPRFPPVSRVQKVRRAGNSEVHIRTPPPHLPFSFGKGAKVAHLSQRSWPNIVSATQLLVKVLDWGPLCPSSTTDPPSCCQPPLGLPEGGPSLRNFSLSSGSLSQPPLHLCLETDSAPGGGMDRVLVHFHLFPRAVLPVKGTNDLAAGGRWNGD